ncbi:MAG: hypothetical protein HYV02_03460 [Deltaproteobacteria bacterium]|nr:hypothetical protein [Deltaproteobacteria bacterium]
MKRHVVIFGNKWNVVHHVRAMGYEPVVVHGRCPEGCRQWICVEEEGAEQADTGLLKALDFSQIVGLVNCSEYYVSFAAAVREAYAPQLPGLRREQAALVRDKVLLKQHLQRVGIATTRFTRLDRQASWGAIADRCAAPFLVKPRKGMLARHITLIDNEATFARWRGETPHVEDYYAEAYLPRMREYCCDTLVSDGRVFAQFPGEYTVSCLESNQKHAGYGVNFPGFLPESERAVMKEMARQFIASAGIRDGFCHCEFFHTTEGWTFGEIGCRLPGGYQIPTESHMAGESIMDLYLRMLIATEDAPRVPLELADRYCGYYLYPKKTGRVTRVTTDFDHPWIIESKVFVAAGDEIAHEDSSVAMSGVVVYAARSPEELREHAVMAPNLMTVEMDA